MLKKLNSEKYDIRAATPRLRLSPVSLSIVKVGRQHHLVRSTCAAAFSVRSSPLGANTMCKSRNSFADALFTQGLMALMQPTICCARAQSAREFVTEFSGGATPHRSGVAQS